MRKRRTKLLAAGSVLLAAATSQALAVDVGGVDIPLGITFSAGQIYTNVPVVFGDALTGYGKIDSINSIATGDLCGGCELTYVFDGYTLDSADATGFYFDGGSVRVYMGVGATKDFSTRDAGSSVADDVAEASNGTLWLTLKGHAINAAGNTFRSQGEDVGTPSFTGHGFGLLDVDTGAGGVANAVFDSNGVVAAHGGGNADFIIGSSFNGLAPPYPDTLAGSMDLTTTAVPEPETYALMLSALGLIGYVVRRRRRV
ncbi:MAG: PEP-CTERM sorting domain-containing protein [Burkholderiales bacterium]|nr:PEP-CTERM sorting domain-containing protein [Burkholderiales bacterium]